jgi:hypothetical protein
MIDRHVLIRISSLPFNCADQNMRARAIPIRNGTRMKALGESVVIVRRARGGTLALSDS